MSLQQVCFILFLLSTNKTILKSLVSMLIKHLKKLLGSDWLKRSAFLVNTVQKRVTRVQITTKISEVKTKTAGGRCISKTAKDCAKPSDNFQRSPKYFRSFPNFARILPKTCDNLRRSPKLFQVLEDRRQYLLRTSIVNVWSEALSCLFFQVYY